MSHLTLRHVVFDTETTGFVAGRVIEVAALEFDPVTGVLGERLHCYANPAPDYVEPGASRVHGLHNSFLARHPGFDQIGGRLQDFIRGAACYAHNAPFDRRVLNGEFERLGLPELDSITARVVCTLEQARKRLPTLTARKLDALCDHYGIDRSGRSKHGALLDCELLAQVIVRLRQEPLPEPPPSPPPPPTIPKASPATNSNPRPIGGWQPGGKWLQDELDALFSSYAAGTSLEGIAVGHNRSPFALALQLERHGKIASDEVQRLFPNRISRL